jgi:chromosomal replication initiation ATPase DnaA
VQKDGETVSINLPKEESSGLINNQLESIPFKARAQTGRRRPTGAAVVPQLVASGQLSLNACECHQQHAAGHPKWRTHRKTQCPSQNNTHPSKPATRPRQNPQFDGVLENVSQEAVYGAAGADAVEAVLSGYNATVFCYGQTGAGKTFTMSGDGRNYAHRGIVPRALHQIFREIDTQPDKTYRWGGGFSVGVAALGWDQPARGRARALCWAGARLSWK